MIRNYLRPTALAIAPALLTALALAVAAFGHSGTADVGAAQTSLAIDADPADNAPTSIGSVDNCVEVALNDTFDVDFVVSDATDLLGWETYLAYDKSVLSVADRDVQMFLTDGPKRDVFDASERVPDADGLYRLTAVDIASPPYPHTGSGVLARVTFTATGEGISFVSATPIDRNKDGKPDIGPVFKDNGNNLIGDANGDTFFDGPTADARVAVDAPCSVSESGPLSNALSDGGSVMWMILGLGAGVTAVGLTAAFTFWSRRARAGTVRGV